MKDTKKEPNILYTLDNLFVLYGLNSESVDLIYLDPPFNSKRFYSAPVGSKSAGASFKDMWTWDDVDEAYLDKLVENYPILVDFIKSIQKTHSKAMMAYITYMTQRLIEMHRTLKQTGSLYLHCDPTASHYLKIILDGIFGKNNFRNEIIWHYGTGGVGKKTYAKKHDVITWYSKGKDYPFSQPRTQSKDLKRFNKTDKDGRKYYDKGGSRYYADRGVTLTDVWGDIYPVRNVSKERTGYPTQKPLALLKRIIEASSKEGDLVLDPFCGCATTCVSAQQLKRRWIGIDIEKNAASVLIQRLEKDGFMGDGFTFVKKGEDFVHTEITPVRTDVEKIAETNKSVRDRLFKKQKGLCNACEGEFERNLEVDHIIPKSKGGGDYFENYQLLCGHCNRIKGNRPMEYLRIKIKARNEALEKKITFGE